MPPPENLPPLFLENFAVRAKVPRWPKIFPPPSFGGPGAQKWLFSGHIFGKMDFFPRSDAHQFAQNMQKIMPMKFFVATCIRKGGKSDLNGVNEFYLRILVMMGKGSRLRVMPRPNPPKIFPPPFWPILSAEGGGEVYSTGLYIILKYLFWAFQ